MNREIKFRALYRDKWYMVEEFRMYEDGSFSASSFQGENFSPNSEHVKCIVQFTGLKDKQGVEIYEGDIISQSEKQMRILTYVKGVVVYKKDRFIIDWKGDTMYNQILRNHINEIQIIGNIYEHSELLK